VGLCVLYAGILFPDLGTGLCDFGDGIYLRCAIIGQDTFHFSQYDCFELPVINATRDVVITEINLQPNPALDDILIPEGLLFIGMTTINGQSLLTYYDENLIHIADLPTGLYILRFVSADKLDSYFGKVFKL